MKAPRVIDCPVIVLVGPTAVGKTALSLQLVERFDCEIISMDSMQVYRHMDIGTAKPSREERSRVAHHLIDIVDPDEQYDAARFVKDCLQAMDEIAARNRAVLLTGGTGLYLKALLEGLFADMPADVEVRDRLRQRLAAEGRDVLHAELCQIDPVTGARVHRNDTQRLLRGLEIYQVSGHTWSELIARQQAEGQGIQFRRLCQLALHCERQELYDRIALRSRIMLDQGLVEEVQQLRAMGYTPNLPSMQSIGYRHANALLDGTWDQDTMLEHLVRDTRRYAKRQMTWFGRNNDLHWVDRKDWNSVVSLVERQITA
jgi:tRNA dimethylallyltransferase